ncbi:uridine kinase [Pseudonocardia acaciae]|uniref:uridine kinase n=1 Tax=Pseudonocardia acaciae TaxID=551276 RepID=UPI0004918321|nr:uridine kinase [Pseudonocardia acaciae]
MRVRPIRPTALVDELAERIVGRFAERARVLLDGAPPSRPESLAEELAEALRLRGRPAIRVAASDFWRPASVRLEHGRRDPDELLDGWLDAAGLRREVLDPAAPSGSGWVLPRLWDSRIDRAYRDSPVPLATNGVLLLSGSLLLGRGLPAELTVHLQLSTAALQRRLDPDLHWTLPAYRRYDAERDPTNADVLVLADDSARPALVVR